jgi:hypothetical protein
MITNKDNLKNRSKYFKKLISKIEHNIKKKETPNKEQNNNANNKRNTTEQRNIIKTYKTNRNAINGKR